MFGHVGLFVIRCVLIVVVDVVVVGGGGCGCGGGGGGGGGGGCGFRRERKKVCKNCTPVLQTEFFTFYYGE